MPGSARISKRKTRNSSSFSSSKKSSRTPEPTRGEPDPRLILVTEAAKHAGVGEACAAIGLSRAYFYRQRKPAPSPAPNLPLRPRRARALTPAQEERILLELNSERFPDCSPRQVWATLLDAGVSLCSWRTMYRLLKKNQQVQERRTLRRHPKYARPEFEASGPNQVGRHQEIALADDHTSTYLLCIPS
jgi:hypothetical protein